VERCPFVGLGSFGTSLFSRFPGSAPRHERCSFVGLGPCCGFFFAVSGFSAAQGM
jgi:hypothetical protein